MMYVYHMYAWCYQGQMLDPLERRVTDHCKSLPHGCWELYWSPI